MIIHITKSKIFTIDPALRFAKRYKCKPEVWNEIWKRHGLLGYDNDGLCGYFLLKTGIMPDPEAIRRWIVRTEIYCKATHVRNMGVRVVDSSYFGAFEQDVINEMTRHMKYGEAKESRSVV